MLLTFERMDVVEAGDVLDAHHAFMHRLMRQPGRADDIADGIHAGLAGLAPLVDHDMRAIDFHLGLLEPHILDIADDADGEDDALELDLLRLLALNQRRDDAVGVLLQLLHRGRGEDLHALLLERLLREGGDFLVLDRQHAVEHFDHRHLDAEIAIEAGEFDADRARADDEQRFRQLLGAPSLRDRSRSACRRARGRASRAPARRSRG